MPSSASIDLPPMHMDAEYRPQTAGDVSDILSDHRLSLREGHYLDCVATVGQFEHQLSTDLLNHLVLVQKVFVKVNQLFQECLCRCVASLSRWRSLGPTVSV